MFLDNKAFKKIFSLLLQVKAARVIKIMSIIRKVGENKTREKSFGETKEKPPVNNL